MKVRAEDNRRICWRWKNRSVVELPYDVREIVSVKQNHAFLQDYALDILFRKVFTQTSP